MEYELSTKDDKPVSLKQAIRDPNRKSWLVAIEKGIVFLEKSNIRGTLISQRKKNYMLQVMYRKEDNHSSLVVQGTKLGW